MRTGTPSCVANRVPSLPGQVSDPTVSPHQPAQSNPQELSTKAVGPKMLTPEPSAVGGGGGAMVHCQDAMVVVVHARSTRLPVVRTRVPSGARGERSQRAQRVPDVRVMDKHPHPRSLSAMERVCMLVCHPVTAAGNGQTLNAHSIGTARQCHAPPPHPTTNEI